MQQPSVSFSRYEWRAFLLAPLAAPVTYWLGFVLLELARTLRGVSGRPFPGIVELARNLGVIVVFGAPVAFGVAVVFGLPIYLALRRRSPREESGPPLPGWRRTAVVGAGVALGLVTATVLAPHLRGGLFSVPMPLWAGALLGLTSALCFVWLLRPAIHRRNGAARAQGPVVPASEHGR